MSKKIGLRVFYIANASLACLNLLLFAFLLCGWSLPVGRSGATVRKDAAIMGMDVYSVRCPFAIFVDRDFPGSRGFTFCEYGPQLLLSAKDVDGNDAEERREVLVSLGADFSIGFVYSLLNATKIEELVVTKNNEGFIDINVDGFFDTRITYAGIPAHHEIWYEGKWREVVRGHGGRDYEMELRDGEVVSFDWESGRWRSRRHEDPR